MITKTEILTWLKENMNQWCSGQEISERLSVSRAAISKQIGNLKREGYDIVSAPKKGYKLRKVADLLSPQELVSILETEIFGRREVIYLTETGSTNTVAKDAAVKGAAEGTLVIAETQTQGRGRKSRSWNSPAGGGIYLSMILRPKLAPQETPVLTLMTAVALTEAVIRIAKIAPVIKWPNDLLINGKKLAGILTEMSAQPDSVEFVVVGVGVNVNTSEQMFSEQIRAIATSLRIETGRSHYRPRLLAEFLLRFEKYHDLFRNRQFEAIMEKWRHYSDIVGRRVVVDVLGRRTEGKVTGIETSGALILQDEQGEDHRILSGDVLYLD